VRSETGRILPQRRKGREEEKRRGRFLTEFTELTELNPQMVDAVLVKLMGSEERNWKNFTAKTQRTRRGKEKKRVF
jgi:hypothetical protein